MSNLKLETSILKVEPNDDRDEFADFAGVVDVLCRLKRDDEESSIAVFEVRVFLETLDISLKDLPEAAINQALDLASALAELAESRRKSGLGGAYHPEWFRR